MQKKIIIGRRKEDDEYITPILTFPEKKSYKEFEQTFQYQHIHYYLSEDIGNPEEYSDMVYRILTASSYDEIYIHLNTSGGRLDTGVQLINAMKNSPAKIITVLDGMAYSLGTLIFLAGDEMRVNDHCIIMFHNFRGGLVGKGNEIASELEATVRWFTELAKELYIPFLSEHEFNRILKGEDLWMNSDEVRVRLNNIFSSEKVNKYNEEELISPSIL